MLKTKIAHILLWAASWLKAGAKLLLPKNVVADILTLPGWYVLDCLIFHTTVYKGKVIGIRQESWLMPKPWVKEMQRLKGKI